MILRFKKLTSFGFFIILIPFLHILGYQNFSIPMMFSGLAFTLFLVKKQINLIFYSEDILLISILIIGLFAQLINMDLMGIRYLSHLFFWYMSIFLFYFWSTAWIKKTGISMEQLSIAFIISSIIASLGVIFDFLLVNFVGFYISDVIPYSIGEMEETKNLYNLFYRPRGFSAEPGFTSVVFEMLVPLAAVYLFKRSTTLFFIYIIIILFGYILLTSAASYLSLAIAFILFFLMIFNFKHKLYLLLFLSLTYFFFYNYINLYFLDVVVVKLLGVFEGDSDRLKIYLSLIELSINKPFGIGFGALASAFFSDSSYAIFPIYGAGAISLYIEVLIASGLVGLLLFILFIFIKVYKAYYISNSLESLAILFSLLLVLSHHIFISEVTFPMFWVILSLASSIKFLEKN